MSFSSDAKPVRPPGEFELIAALKQVIDSSQMSTAENVVVGIGDDASAVELTPGVQVMTTDTMVDGIHFLRSKASWRDVGWKSAVSNLSDIAAMGALPSHALVTLGVPPDVTVGEMEQMYGGMTEAFAKFGGSIVGGDVVSSPVFFVTVALTGLASELDGTPALLRRDTAQPGDLIGVTGNLGGSAGGLRVIRQELSGVDADALKRLHYSPVPRIREGQSLIEGGVRCGMDISDGLIADLEKICTASEVGAVVNAADVPVPAELKTAFADDAREMALSGGEDYELLFTAPFDLMDRLLARHRGMVTHIGSVTEQSSAGNKVRVLDSARNEISVQRKGWDHLSAR